MNTVMNVVATHWSANAVVVAGCSAVVVVHLRGMRATAAGAGQREHGPVVPKTAAVAFYFGLLAVVVAVLSPVAYWSLRYPWVRSVQDVLLAVVAPGLIVLGAPWTMLARGVRRGRPPAIGVPASPEPAAAVRSPGGTYPWSPRRRVWLTWPVAVTVAFNAAWWAWHMPDLYDAALRLPLVRAAEFVTYLGLGVVLWLQLIGSDPVRPQFPPLRRVMLVAGTVASNTVLGIGLVFGASLLYPAYLATAHGVSGVVAGQQVSGAVLWLMPLPAFIIVAVALVLHWLNEEEAEALTAGFGRLLEPPTSAWPSRPGLR